MPAAPCLQTPTQPPNPKLSPRPAPPSCALPSPRPRRAPRHPPFRDAASNVPSQAALIYLCVAQPAWGAVAYVPNIMSERALYVRERHDGLYRPITYLAFKV